MKTPRKAYKLALWLALELARSALAQCTTPNSIIGPPIGSQTYTLTTAAQTYTFAPFFVDPPECEITYSFTVTPDTAIDVVSLDPATRTLTFFYDQGVALAGDGAATYFVVLQGSAGTITIQDSVTFLQLVLKNPCLDNTLVGIENATLLTQTYTLSSLGPTGLQWTHSDSSITGSTEVQTYCGDISYKAFYQGVAVTQTSTPLSYDPSSKTFTFYTEDPLLIGSVDYSLRAYLASYSQIESQFDEMGYIDVVSTCETQATVTATAQTDPAPYAYTGDSPKTLHFINPFGVNPSYCEVTYTCEMTAPALAADLCNFAQGTTMSEFDSLLGSYSFQSTDMVGVPPGDYVFQVTGTAGDSSAVASFTLTLEDPCDSASIVLEPNTFEDITYGLGESPILVNQLFSNLYEVFSSADCGPVSINFLNSADLSPVDTNLFSSSESIDAILFEVLEQSDPLTKGTYSLTYEVLLENYPFTKETQTVPFSVFIVDPCDSPLQVVGSILSDQVYTLTDTAVQYTFDAFFVEPAQCVVTFTYLISDDAARVAIAFDSDTRTFTFSYTSDLDLVGPENSSYFIEVIGQTGNVVAIQDSAFFLLELRNPCIDPAIVTIQPSTMLDQAYTLTTQGPGGFQWSHDPFQVTGNDFVADLCGEVVYLASFLGAAIDEFSTPMSYDGFTRTFNFYSEDRSLIGVNDFRITGVLLFYPEITTQFDAIAFLDVIDPCLTSATVTATAQFDPLPYAYTGSSPDLLIFLDPFTVEPSFCEVTYSCVMTSPATTDLCNFDDGTTITSFDSTLGIYSLKTTDNIGIPPGDYIFEITGTVGTSTDTTTFTVTLEDPCLTTGFTFLSNPFTEVVYRLGELSTLTSKPFSDIFELQTEANCGPMTVNFLNEDLTPLDPLLFSGLSLADSALLEVLEQNDPTSIASYQVVYEVVLDNYPSVSDLQATPFTVRIIDPCDEPVTIVGPPLTDQTYTLTTAPIATTFAPFFVEPAQCDIAYTLQITDLAGEAAVTLDSDSRTITFFYDTNLDLSGPVSSTYFVEVVGRSGNVVPVEGTTFFVLELKNPCIDPTLTVIQSSILLDQEYTLATLGPAGLSWTHDPFTLEGSANIQSLCGEVQHEASFLGSAVDEFSTPMSYDAFTRTFSFYSEDTLMIGSNDFGVTAYLFDYPDMRVDFDAIAFLDVIDPCLTSASVTATAQFDPLPYAYTGSSPDLLMFLDPFTVEPSFCEVTYSCVMTSPASTDLCNFDDGTTITSFDSTLGIYSLKTTDNIGIPPGDYIFEITGTVGTSTDTTTFTVTLEDPCLTTSIILKANPFEEVVYRLGELSTRASKPFTDLFELQTDADCGPVSVTFLNQDLSPLDPFLFEGSSSADQAFFEALEQTDFTSIDIYKVVYEVSLDNYPGISELQTAPISVRIIDPCDEPVTVVGPAMTDQTYTLTTAALQYTFEPFFVEPALCEISYSFAINDVMAEAVVTFDSNTRSFNFFYDGDLDPAGPTSSIYFVEVTGTSGNVQPVEGLAFFVLELKNPCIDPAVTAIQSALLLDQEYTLATLGPAGLSWTHDPFTLQGSAAVQTFCGEVVHEASFLGSAVDEFSTPMSYDAFTRTFSFYSEDTQMIGSNDFGVTAYLFDYPDMRVDFDAIAFLDVIDPCLTSATVTATAQFDPLPYAYTGSSPDLLMFLDPFTVEPSFCEVTYSCVMTSPATTDLCNFDDGTTITSFDPTLGIYSLKTTDNIGITPGDYIFEITGTVGTSTDTTTFTVTLEDPCLTTSIILKANPFEEMAYMLGEPSTFVNKPFTDIFELQTEADCGPIIVTFLNEDLTPLDPLLFEGLSFVDSASFDVLEQSEPASRGTYSFVYEVTLIDYSISELQTDSFTVRIIDPCAEPVIIVGSVFSDQTYTLTTDPLSFTFEPFFVEPAQCPVTYSFTITDLAGEVAVTLDQDMRTFTFFYDTNLDLAGLSSTIYFVEVMGSAGDVVAVEGISFFTLELKNPCVDPTLTVIQSSILLDQEYTLATLGPAGLSWTHDPFTLEGSANIQSLCGEVQHEASFLGSAVDEFSTPMSYDAFTRTFSFYSEDTLMIGSNDFGVTAYLFDYPDMRVDFDAIAFLDVIDPCLTSASVTATAQFDPLPYAYTGSSPDLLMFLDPFTVEPSFCEVTYSCVMTSPATTDLCNFDDGTTITSFDPTLGIYSLKTTDNIGIPPGDYIFEITGTVGTSTDTTTFTVTLEDPCEFIEFSLLPNPFNEQSYLLTRPEIVLPYTASDLYTVFTQADCGPQTISFFNSADESPLDPGLFSTSANSFTVLQTADLALRGTYSIAYRVEYDLSPLNSLTQDTPFVVTVADDCENPLSLVASALESQVYAVGSLGLDYFVPGFVSDPASCEVTYEYQITSSFGEDALIFDPVSPMFTFDSSDLGLVGEYTVLVTGTSGTLTPVSGSASFQLTLINPCLDPAYLTIQSEPLLDQDYVLGQSAHSWTFSEFTVLADPSVEALCGPLVYQATFMGLVVDQFTQPVTFDALTMTFEVSSQDLFLIGLQDFTVEAYLEEHPLMRTDFPEIAFLNVIDPCLTSASVTATAQFDPLPYAYTGSSPDLLMFLDPFTVEPSFCEVTYSCVMTSPATTDLCNFDDGTTITSFDSTLGIYSLKTTDNIGIPPGDYIFEITGTVGASSDTTTFTVTLEDPCPNADFFMNPIPLTDTTHRLSSPEQLISWTLEELVTLQTQADCGPISVTFLNTDESPLDTNLFSQTVTDLVLLETADTALIGDYLVTYRVEYDNNPLISRLSQEHFTVSVIGLCDSPVLTLPSFSDIEYTVTDEQRIEVIPGFSVEPSVCEVAYSASVGGTNLDSLISFDPDTLELTISQMDDLALSGNTQTDYPVVVQAISGDNTQSIANLLFTLRVKNPCRDPAYFSFSPVDLPTDLSFTIAEIRSAPGGKVEFTHNEFLVEASAEMEALCGDLIYAATLDGQIIDDNSEPISYDEKKRSFRVTDFDLAQNLGQKELTLWATLREYQSVAPVKVTSTIEILESCATLDGTLCRDIMPFWMQRVSDQTVMFGSGVDLEYNMGDPLNYLQEQMEVSVEVGQLWLSSYFAQDTNTVHVLTGRLETWTIGQWPFKVTASYREDDGSLISYEKTFTLTIVRPPALIVIEEEEPSIFVPETPYEIDSKGERKKDNLLVVDLSEVEYEVITVTQAEEKAQKQGGPKPYIKDFTWTGELTIGWSKQLKPIEGADVLPQQKVAIESAYFDSPGKAKKANGRRLQQTELIALTDDDLQQEIRLLIEDAVKLEILRSEPEDEDSQDIYVESGFSWRIKDYSSDELTLQVDLEQPENVSQRASVGFDTFKVTFYGTQYFKDEEDREVPFGTQLTWKVFRQLAEESADTVLNFKSGLSYLFYVVLALFLMLALCGGPLIPVWMFYNAFQLLVHLPMLRSTMPAATNFFLIEFLKMSKGAPPKALAEPLGFGDSREDFEYIESREDEDSSAYFNELTFACGYHLNIARDILHIFAILAFLLFIWLCCALLRSKCCVKEQRVSNVIVRFCYEVIFEVAICLLITFSTGQQLSLGLPTLICMVFILMIAALLILMFVLCLCKGPYQENWYRDSVWPSFIWGYRRVHQDKLDTAYKLEAQEAKRLEYESAGSQMANEGVIIVDTQEWGDDLKNMKIPLQLHKNLQRTQGSVPSSEQDFKGGSQGGNFTENINQTIMSSELKAFASKRGSMPTNQEATYDDRLASNEGPRPKSSRQSLRSAFEGGEPEDGHQASQKSLRLVDDEGLEALESAGEELKQKQVAVVHRNAQPNTPYDKGYFVNKKTTRRRSSQKKTYGQRTPQTPLKSPIHDSFSHGHSLQQSQTFQKEFDQNNFQVIPPRQNTIMKQSASKKPQFFQSEDSHFKNGKQEQAQVHSESFEDFEADGSAEQNGPHPMMTSRALISRSSSAQSFSQNSRVLQQSKSKHWIEADRRKQILIEAKLRLEAESSISVSSRYATLFEGLKRNHQHNGALVQPFVFLLRRFAFAAILILLFDRPFLSVLLLLGMSLAALCWVASQHQWSHSLINRQHFLNEAVLYFCLVLLVLCSDTVHSVDTSEIVGWTMIAVILLSAAYNLIIIVYFAARHLKLVFKRRVTLGKIKKHRRAVQQRKGKKIANQVAPAPTPGFDGVDFCLEDLDEEPFESEQSIDLKEQTKGSDLNFSNPTKAGLLQGTSGTARGGHHFFQNDIMLNPIAEEAFTPRKDGTDSPVGGFEEDLIGQVPTQRNSAQLIDEGPTVECYNTTEPPQAITGVGQLADNAAETLSQNSFQKPLHIKFDHNRTAEDIDLHKADDAVYSEDGGKPKSLVDPQFLKALQDKKQTPKMIGESKKGSWAILSRSDPNENSLPMLSERLSKKATEQFVKEIHELIVDDQEQVNMDKLAPQGFPVHKSDTASILDKYEDAEDSKMIVQEELREDSESDEEEPPEVADEQIKTAEKNQVLLTEAQHQASPSKEEVQAPEEPASNSKQIADHFNISPSPNANFDVSKSLVGALEQSNRKTPARDLSAPPSKQPQRDISNPRQSVGDLDSSHRADSEALTMRGAIQNRFARGARGSDASMPSQTPNDVSQGLVSCTSAPEINEDNTRHPVHAPIDQSQDATVASQFKNRSQSLPGNMTENGGRPARDSMKKSKEMQKRTILNAARKSFQQAGKELVKKKSTLKKQQ